MHSRNPYKCTNVKIQSVVIRKYRKKKIAMRISFLNEVLFKILVKNRFPAFARDIEAKIGASLEEFTDDVRAILNYYYLFLQFSSNPIKSSK